MSHEACDNANYNATTRTVFTRRHFQVKSNLRHMLARNPCDDDERATNAVDQKNILGDQRDIHEVDDALLHQPNYINKMSARAFIAGRPPSKCCSTDHSID